MHRLHKEKSGGSGVMIGVYILTGLLALFVAWIYVMLIAASPTEEERRMEDMEQCEFLKKWRKTVE